MGGGAWPFLVGGVSCLVNSDNERDLRLLNSHAVPCALAGFDVLEGLCTVSAWTLEAITGL